MSLDKAVRSSLPALALLLVVGLTSCANQYSVRLGSPTTELTTARMQMSTAMGDVSCTGFEVDTVGNDTVVTRFLRGSSVDSSSRSRRATRVRSRSASST